MGYRVPRVLRPRRSCREGALGAPGPGPLQRLPGVPKARPGRLPAAGGAPRPDLPRPAPGKLLWFPPPCLNEGMDALFSLRQLPNATLLSLENGRH